MVAQRESRLDVGAMALVAAVAAALRLVPVLRGAGLYGSISYDGSVYYAAAAGVVHGLVPYRDFLLLHPPGIVLVLLPFAALGRFVGDPTGLAAARVAFILLGPVNAVLVAKILRPQGRWAALAGGFFYAAFFPAVFMERSISLEGAATVCELVALLLLLRPRRGSSPTRRALLVAGMLLGFGASLKIWGVVVVAALVLWCWRTLGLRSAALTAGGAVLAVGVVCGSFLVAAGSTMWRMVVLDQLGRPRSPSPLRLRVQDILGLSGPQALPLPPLPATVLGTAVVIGGLCVVLAARTRTGRCGVLLLGSCVGLLLVTPSWFAHYAGLVAAPAALVVGAATSRLVPHLNPRRAGAVVAALAVSCLALSVGIGTSRTFGSPLPTRQIAAAAAATAGCVTADDPTLLTESDLLRRNFARGCPLVVDLGGYSYDLPRSGQSRTRSHNRSWQTYATSYLASGTLAVIGRFHAGSGFSNGTASTVDRWPVVARGTGFRVRRPS